MIVIEIAKAPDPPQGDCTHALQSPLQASSGTYDNLTESPPFFSDSMQNLTYKSFAEANVARRKSKAQTQVRKMAENTKIEWTDHTFNPWMGCNKVSAECKHCYIDGVMRRTGRVPFNGPMRTKHWNKPYTWQRKAESESRRFRIFTCSMSDFFHPGADAWRDEAWEVIRRCTSLDWLVLTKRPELVPERLPRDWGDGYPNVWLGVTCGVQKSLSRVDLLRQIPAKIRFVSAEPLMEPIDFSPYLDGSIHWIITGCEQAHKEKRRPMDIQWVRDIDRQCRNAGIAHFFKQRYEGTKLVTDGRLDGVVRQIWPDQDDVFAPLQAEKKQKAGSARPKKPRRQSTRQKTRRNAEGLAFSALSYQQFIEKVVDESGGYIAEEKLDHLIEDAYGELWGPTDLECWGDQSHPKWKQNVASAKSGLDRRGIIVRYVAEEAVPVQKAKPGWKIVKRQDGLYRKVQTIYRVRLPKAIAMRALYQWQSRMPPKRKRSYAPLPQPATVDFVPD